MIKLMLGMAGIGGMVAVLAALNVRRDPRSVAVDWRVVHRPAFVVVAEPPSRGLIIQTVTAPGTIVPADQVRIGSQLVGRVATVPIKEGDQVRQGDLLIKIDETDARARLDSSTAKISRLSSAIAHADADLRKANRDVDNFGRLANRGALSTIELADARSAMAKSSASLEMCRFEMAEAEALRRINQQELSRTEIRAPIDGIVSGLNVEPGEVIIAGTTNLPGSVLMTISDLKRMKVRADVDETDLPMVRVGQAVRVYLQADPATPIAGTVERIASWGKKSDEGVSFETIVLLTDPKPGLQPEMTATAEFEVHRAPDALGVPVQAVLQSRRSDLPDTPAVRSWLSEHDRSSSGPTRGEDLQYVRVVYIIENGLARARPVEVGWSDEHRAEVVAGLSPSDQVIVGPFRALDDLKDGSPVVLVAPEAAASPRGTRP